jgi:predicted oxidoreductase
LKLDPAFRSKIEIVTKCGIYVPCQFHPDRKVAHYNVTAARIIKSAEKSLRFLGTDHIDLLLVHRPDWLTSADETAEGLNKLLKEGKIRSAGYDGTADQCQRLKILPMAWSPLAKGALMNQDDPAAARLHAKAAELSAKYDGATLDQLAYAWIMAHPSTPLPIIGTNKLERIQAVVKAAEIKLEREDWYGLWQAAKGHGVP